MAACGHYVSASTSGRVVGARPLASRHGRGRRADLDATSGVMPVRAFPGRRRRRRDRCGSGRRLRRWRRFGSRGRRARRSRGSRLGIGLWCGRRLGRGGRDGCAPRRKERERIDVRLARADADAEMDVRNGMLRFAGRTGVGDHIAFRDESTAPDAQRPEVRQRHLVVLEFDRHREAVRRDLAREGDGTPDGRAHRPRAPESDVDPAVLTRGVRVSTDGESLEDLPVRRPCPRPRGCAGHERPAQGDPDAGRPPPDRARCPSSEHATTVARARAGGNAV